MKRVSRSISGAAIGLLLVPVFIGLLACIPTFPVPVGDPEKSRIDPDLSGLWVGGSYDELAIVLFEPYDKRTWLLSSFGLSADEERCDWGEADEFGDRYDDLPLPGYDEIVAFIVEKTPDCFLVEPGMPSKGWRTKIGKHWFLTQEPKGLFDAEKGTDSEVWFVYRIDKPGPNQLRLWWVNPEHAAFDKLDTEKATSRKIEKIIRKHADDRSLYPDENDEDEPNAAHRVRPEHFELLAELIETAYED